MASKQLLSVQGIDKRFSGVHALRSVSFDLRPGEIHALVGENGAGKSTLMKILTGIYTADWGEIYYMGQPFNPRSPKHAMDLGIGIIHQELNMMDHLTVAQNIFIGRESMRGNGVLLDERAQNKRSGELLQRLNMNIEPTQTLGDLTVGRQQMVEIAKAVSHNLQVLILDEPTAALTDTEIDELFTIMRDLRGRGVGMIHISHRLDEIHQIADRVSVMRDGELVGTREVKEITKQDIINMMVGRVIYEEPKTKSSVAEDADIVLKVKNLFAGPLVQNVSFELRRGEILGFAGLIGAGRTETARAIFGADQVQSGTIEIHGKPSQIKSPTDAVAQGVGYLSEDRKRFGVALGRTVAENIVLPTLEKFDFGPFVKQNEVDGVADEYVDKLNIKTPSVRQLVRNLSGGNQQKVVLAKWLVRNSDILIFDEPTRGIDVGAKSEIYALMNQLAADGKSIIMISSELPEILRMSDRIVVMCEGRVTGELDISAANQEKIMEYATMRLEETVIRG
jgi:ribose transport system ATP-binding protein